MNNIEKLKTARKRLKQLKIDLEEVEERLYYYDSMYDDINRKIGVLSDAVVILKDKLKKK